MQGHCKTTEGSYEDFITEGKVCGKSIAGNTGSGTCFGDSGGPITSKNGPRHTLVGINSRGFSCASVSVDSTPI